MLYLRSWIEDYIDLKDYTNEDLKHLITMKSGEVEDIIEITDYFDGKVLVGKIENLRKHPGADKLNIFDVNLGSKGNIQIVSAAPNSRNGLIVAVATVGTSLPMGVIAQREMRGEKSQGMCLGMSELLLETEYSSGLWELNQLIEDKKFDLAEVLGKSICQVAPEFFPKDTVFDIKYLADKISACGNHLGLALELSICLEKPELLTHKARQIFDPAYLAEIILQDVDMKNKVNSINFQDKSGYSNSFFLFDLQFEQHYALPHELQTRMFLTQKNLIGGLADLSNYLLYDVGQPTHIFSKDKVLRLNQNQPELTWEIEKLTESTHFAGLGQLKSISIPAGVEVLKQGENILTIPGISGSESTKSEEKDKHVLLEIANFPSQNVARSSFQLNYRSEGARIWAGGVKICLQFVLLARMVEVLKEYNSGNSFKLSTLIEYINPALIEKLEINESENLLQKVTRIFEFYLNRNLEINAKYLSDRLDKQGLENWQEIIEQKLNIIGKYQNGNLYPGVFYQNINSQEDVLEQVSRLIGYDKLLGENLNSNTHTKLDKSFDKLNELKKLFLNFGFYEIITRPFLAKNKLIRGEKFGMELLNSANSAQTYIRDSLFPSLMQVVAKNIFGGEKDVRVFEYTKLYQSVKNGEIKEIPVIEACLLNTNQYIVTSFISDLAKKFGLKNYTPKNLHEPYSNLGSGYSYDLDGIEVNFLKVNNKQKRSFDIPLTKDVWYLSINLENWSGYFNTFPTYHNETEFSVIIRNYSYFVDKKTTWAEIVEMINKYNLDEVEIRIKPQERLNTDNSENSDIINYQVDFVSYTKNLEGLQVDEWENLVLADKTKLLKLRY